MMPPRYRHPGTRLQILVASVFMILYTLDAAATNLKMDVIPSVRLEEGWNSNVFNAADNEVSSFGTRLTPGLALKFTTSDGVVFQISGSYEKVWYYEPEAKEANTDTYYFRLNSSGELRFTPKLSMVPSVYYINTTNSFRRNQLLPTDDPVVPSVSYINYGATKTEDFGAGVAFNYMAAPKLRIELKGHYGEQRFVNDTSGSGGGDSTTAGGGVSVSYLYTPRTSFGPGVSGSHQTYENNPNSDILSAGILLDHQFSPELRVNGAVGMSRVRVDSALGIPEQEYSNPAGYVRLSYTSGTFTANIFGSAGYGELSGFGKPTYQWTAGLWISDQFAKAWSWDLSGNYQVSREDVGADLGDVRTTYGTAGLRYQPWAWAGLDLTGNINRQTTSGQLWNPVDTYSVILGFTIGKPYNIF